MQAIRIDGFQATLFLTLMICLQCNNNDFKRRDVSRNVLYAPPSPKKVNFVR